VNGAVRRDAEYPVHVEKDRIVVNDAGIEPAEKNYLMLNKPRGVVTTASDEKGRKTVYDLLAGKHHWVAPVGRLDKASEGLLLFTNDSEWAARVLAPETHLEKTYHVQVGAIVSEDTAKSLETGIRGEPGVTLRAKSAGVLRRGERNTWLEIVLDEGKNRQIRRMLKSLELEVLRLIRVSVGPLVLGTLPKGASRALTVEEKRSLDQAMKKIRR
jgi:23S rRNA pseudouridine2605 synthase